MRYASTAALSPPSPQSIQSRESGEKPLLQTRVLAGPKNGVAFKGLLPSSQLR